MRQTQSIKQGHTIGLELSLQKCSDYTIYMVEFYYGFGGQLEKLIGRRLHDICSCFINIVIIANILFRVGAVDDDLVLCANLLGFFVFIYACRASHKYSNLLDQVVILLHQIGRAHV